MLDFVPGAVQIYHRWHCIISWNQGKFISFSKGYCIVDHGARFQIRYSILFCLKIIILCYLTQYIREMQILNDFGDLGWNLGDIWVISIIFQRICMMDPKGGVGGYDWWQKWIAHKKLGVVGHTFGCKISAPKGEILVL